MKNWQYIFFDLDGTLTDSQEGITKSVAYALHRFGIEVEDLTTLNVFIGPPLLDSFMKYYDFTEADARKAIDIYREYFSVTGKFENRVYEGVPELLKRLKGAGKKLVVATSKPEVFARQIMEHFDLAPYFEETYGADLEGERTSKDQVLAYALRSRQITDLSQAVMIGDREHDVLGAKKCGLETIGVLYGYGSRQELEESGAMAVVETPEQVAELILAGTV